MDVNAVNSWRNESSGGKHFFPDDLLVATSAMAGPGLTSLAVFPPTLSQKQNVDIDVIFKAVAVESGGRTGLVWSTEQETEEQQNPANVKKGVGGGSAARVTLGSLTLHRWGFAE